MREQLFKEREPMITVSKKYIVDEQGHPQEVVIPWEQYRQIAEILGLDLDENTIADLQQARRDRETRNKNAYIDLDDIQ